MSEDLTPAPCNRDRIARRLARTDERFERNLFWRQLAIVVLVAVLIAALVAVS